MCDVVVPPHQGEEAARHLARRFADLAEPKRSVREALRLDEPDIRPLAGQGGQERFGSASAIVLQKRDPRPLAHRMSVP